MNKVRWGVLSTANIGISKVIPAMQQGKYIEFNAIASRNLEKGKAAAAQLGIPHVYGSYEELLADPNIDAIYNPLANAARQYPQLKVMEAFMYRFHPQWQQTRQMVNEGKIGELRTVQSFFSYFLVDANNIRNIAEAGGGGMMDIGCYTVSLSRYIFGTEPERVCGIVEYDPRFNTDSLSSGILDFGHGTSTFTCSTQLVPYQRVNIFGTTGRIEIEIPFNAPPDKPCKVWFQNGDEIEEILFDICDQYTLQGDAFSQAILNNTNVPTPIEDAVANMKVIEAIIRSAKNGGWV